MQVRKLFSPTAELYGQLEDALEYFNCELFDGQLPAVMVRLQRHVGSSGHFVPARWAKADGSDAHQISLNPHHFAKRPLQDIFQTLVHQMCHLWQHENGSPSRGGYHNQQWATKMKSIGLISTTTGEPDGPSVGQNILEIVVPTGKFKVACLKYVESGQRWQWLDRNCADSLAASNPVGPFNEGAERALMSPASSSFKDFTELKEDADLKLKRKYACPVCGSTVWGKPQLEIACGTCQMDYVCMPVGSKKAHQKPRGDDHVQGH